MLDAAVELEVHLGWVVQTYNATEALANLIHPFWMLPLVGILGLKARDIVGYSMLQFVVHVPLVLFLVWILNYTLTYVPPRCRDGVVGARGRRSRRGRWIAKFYPAMATMLAALVVAGFTPTFYARGWSDAAPLVRTVLVHGVAGTDWVLVFATQSG